MQMTWFEEGNRNTNTQKGGLAMKNMVLVTHADFARGILTSLDLVLGQVGHVDYVSITAKETIPEIASMIEEKITGFGGTDPTVVLTDIAGGGTTQAAMQLGNRRKVYLVTGLNLGLLLEIALLPLGEGEDADKGMLRMAIENSRASMYLVNNLVESQTDTDAPGDLGEL